MNNREEVIAFITGNKLRNLKSDSEQVRFAIVAVVLCAIGVWAAFENGKISMHRNDYNDIALFLLAACCISLALTMLMMRLPKIKLFDFAGKNSIIFFGFHIALIRFLENFGPTAWFAESYAILTAVVVFLALVPVSMFVNKFCPFVVGKKFPPKKKLEGGSGGC